MGDFGDLLPRGLSSDICSVMGQGVHDYGLSGKGVNNDSFGLPCSWHDTRLVHSQKFCKVFCELLYRGRGYHVKAPFEAVVADRVAVREFYEGFLGLRRQHPAALYWLQVNVIFFPVPEKVSIDVKVHSLDPQHFLEGA